MATVKVASLSEMQFLVLKRVTVKGEDILLVYSNGRVFAVGNRCGHQNANLSKGTLSGSIVTCPLHKAKFDLTNGKCVTPPTIGLPPELAQKVPPDVLYYLKLNDKLIAEVEVKPLKTYTVKTEGNNVEIEIPDFSPEPAAITNIGTSTQKLQATSGQ